MSLHCAAVLTSPANPHEVTVVRADGRSIVMAKVRLAQQQQQIAEHGPATHTVAAPAAYWQDPTLLRLLGGHADAQAASVRGMLGPLLSRQYRLDSVHDLQQPQQRIQHQSLSPQSPPPTLCERQGALYDSLLHPVVRAAMEGQNACVLAYGSAGSGKLDLVSGDQHTRGLVGLALDELFAC